MSGGVGVGEVLVGCDGMVRLAVVDKLCCCVDILGVLLSVVVPFPAELALVWHAPNLRVDEHLMVVSVARVV